MKRLTKWDDENNHYDIKACFECKHHTAEDCLHCMYITEIINFTAAYEDAEEQGRFVDIEQVRKILVGYLNGEHYCTRVWEAWNYGTMTEDDFEEIDVDEIIEAIKAEAALNKNLQPLGRWQGENG